MAMRKLRTSGKSTERVRRSSNTFIRVTSRVKGYTAPYENLLKAASSGQLVDPFLDRYETGGLGTFAIRPLYDFSQLAQLPLQNNVLRQCMESYVVNIESHGHTLEYVGPKGQEDSSEAIEEKTRINSFLEAPASGDSLKTIRGNRRWDYETLGNSFLEIARNALGQICLCGHVEGTTMRLTKRDKKPTNTKIITRDPVTGEYNETTIKRHFRRYVQMGSGGQKVYFKEFGDPRSIDPKTGKVKRLPLRDQATEVYHHSIYTPGSVYGMPRWIGNLPAVLGSRESELVNLNFFRENAIPAMAVLVSGGALTEDSFERVDDYINAVRGPDAMHRVMVLEAAADDMKGSMDHSQPAPKIEIKPMISERQQEGLFQAYDDKNAARVRSSFRLPPLLLGRSEDYTRATAYAALLMAENQIFAPEREMFDDFMNKKILITYKPKYWKFKSYGPSLTEPESLAKMLDSFGKQGALTPNAVIKIANQMLDADINPIVEDWGNVPFNIVLQGIKNGSSIPGLDNFIADIDEVGNNTGNIQNDDIEEVATSIRSGLKIISEDIKEAKADGGLQTSAKG